MKNNNFYKIILAGEGGQGVQALSHVFSLAAFNAGFKIAYMPNYGVEQRGGVSLGYLQFGKGEIGFPKFQIADILIIMCERAIHRVEEYINENTLVIYDSGQIASNKLGHITAEKLAIPATEMATKKLSPKVNNMILAGALLNEISILKKEVVEAAVEQNFAHKYKKNPEIRNLNKKALALGEKLAKEAFKKV